MVQGSRFMTVGPATPKVNYGRPLLRNLVATANAMNINVSFIIDMDRHYVVKFNNRNYYPPTAAAACWFVEGIIELQKSKALFPSDSVIDPRD
jgi:hypothetical protein